MNDVLELVKKNFKTLLRAKTGSLVVILGPLLVILLAGLAFDNSNVYAVKIGAYRPDATPITGQLLDQLRHQFKVIEYHSEQECTDAIKNTDINTCMVFSPAFAIGKPPQNQILFYVDYSRINLVYAIMKAMTEQVGEQTLIASQNLTKILLSTLDYTHQRIADQREILVTLATQNDLLTKNTQDLNAELGDLDLSFDTNAFPVDNLTHSKTQLKQWMDATLDIGDKGLSKAQQFINSANELLSQSSASSDTKNALLTKFQQSVLDIQKTQSDLETTKNLSHASFDAFDAQMTQLASGIEATKAKLAEADTSRQFSVRVLDSINTLLDKSLLSILGVQHALNDIDSKINAIEIKDPNAITQPIVTTIKPIVQERTYLNYLFPVLIVLVIMFTALLITPTLILLEKNSPASFRTYLTPVKDSSYILANFITAFLILFVQVLIILSIVSVLFSSKIVANVPKALILLAIVNSVFILFGMIIGYLFSAEETATLAAVSVGALFLFVSDVIIPLESMPAPFAYIASFNPYVLSSSLLRRVLLFNVPITSLLPDGLILIGYAIALTLIATGAYMTTRRYSLQQLMKDLRPVIARVRFKPKK